MPFDLGAGLKGKTVLLTGAAGGIGREAALAFAGAGARVAAVDLDQAQADAVVAEMEGGPHLAIGYDLRPVAGHAALIERVADDVRRPRRARADGGGADPPTERLRSQRGRLGHPARRQSQGVVLPRPGRRAVMVGQGRGGRIINFTSQGWQSGGFGGSVAYAATKGGIVSMTRGLARSLAKDKITVNAVSPGAADTAMMRSGMDDAALAATVNQIPLGYMAQPSQLAGAVLFLASDHADYITGATINVSGGWLMY